MRCRGHKYHLVLPGVVEKTVEVLPLSKEGKICLRKDSRALTKKVGGV